MGSHPAWMGNLTYHRGAGLAGDPPVCFVRMHSCTCKHTHNTLSRCVTQVLMLLLSHSAQPVIPAPSGPPSALYFSPLISWGSRLPGRAKSAVSRGGDNGAPRRRRAGSDLSPSPSILALLFRYSTAAGSDPRHAQSH